MGKRKSSAKPPPKKRMDKLETVFTCPFCNHGSSVECRMDRKDMIGEASCSVCQEKFSTTINALSEPIDVEFQNQNGVVVSLDRRRRQLLDLLLNNFFQINEQKNEA